jgi:aminoglycoside 2'-N-acetyltransferase I
MALSIERIRTSSLVPRVLEQVKALCNEAYGEDLTGYLADIGPGVHLIGWHGPALVSHLMWVDRPLYLEGRPEPLRSAYVELVATRTRDLRHGYATSLLQRLALEIQAYDIGALSPSETTLYKRLGWEKWRGALSVRSASGVVATPEEEVMVLRLPGTPVLDLDTPLAVDWRPGEVW